jgi:hypothetical protein
MHSEWCTCTVWPMNSVQGNGWGLTGTAMPSPSRVHLKWLGSALLKDANPASAWRGRGKRRELPVRTARGSGYKCSTGNEGRRLAAGAADAGRSNCVRKWTLCGLGRVWDAAHAALQSLRFRRWGMRLWRQWAVALQCVAVHTKWIHS